jgi:hypothetical protein
MKKIIKSGEIGPLIMAYTAFMEGAVRFPINTTIKITDALFSLEDANKRFESARDAIIGLINDDNHPEIEAKIGELLEHENEVDLPVLDVDDLAEAGIEIDVRTAYVLRYHGLLEMGE